MKKNYIYLYLDQPAGNEQLYKVFPKNKKLKNYIVKYISSEKINFPKKDLNQYYKHSSKFDVPKNIIKFKNKLNFENFLKELSKNDYIFIRERSFLRNKGLDYDLQLLKKFSVNTIFFEYNNWIKCNFKNELFLNLLRFCWYKVNQFLLSKQDFEPKYYIGSGTEGEKTFVKRKFTNVKYINCPSFWINFKKRKKKNFIIYVDENIHFSRDQFIFDKNYKKTSDPKKFLNDLLNLFNIIEKKFNQKIIICCSKKFRYKKGVFGNRRVVYGKTLQFISESKLVLGHRSDAFYQALYSLTPVILLKHKSFSFKRNMFIFFKSINHFNKKANYIEDYLNKKKSLDFTIDKKYYMKLLKKYFLSPNCKKENFSDYLFDKIDRKLI
jgi:hypothetical protein